MSMRIGVLRVLESRLSEELQSLPGRTYPFGPTPSEPLAPDMIGRGSEGGSGPEG